MRVPLRRPIDVLVLVLLGALGCDPPEPADVPSPTRVGPSEASGIDTPPAPPPPLTGLAPVFRPTGIADRVPEAITVSFTVPLAPDDRAEDGTVAELEPGGVGFVAWATERTLRIVPKEPLPPATEVRLRIEALRTRLGTSEGDALVHVFRTPPFALREARATRIEGNRAELEVELTGPVDPRELRRRLRVTLGGRPAGSVQVKSADEPNVVGVTVRDRLVAKGSPIRLSLEAGLPMAGFEQAKAPAAEARVETAAGGRTMRILHAALEEGSEGWFFRIVCADEAAGEADRYHWDPEARQSFEVSARCVLDEASLEDHVQVTPDTALRVSGTRGGFRLLGALPRGPAVLSITAGARTVDGGILREGFEKSFDIPRRSPELSFAAAGRYVPLDRLDQIPLRARNVERAQIRIERVRPENLVFWASGDREAATSRTADPIAEVARALPGPVDVTTVHTLDLRPLLGSERRGLFEVTVKEVLPTGETERPPAQAVLRVVATNLDLVAKRARAGSVSAWVLDTHTLAPRRGARVRLVQPSGQTRAECTTDRAGGCALALGPVEHDGVRRPDPFGLIAETEDDLAYLAFSEVETPTGEAEVGGASLLDPAPYRAAAWLDRGVYRPGETAHLVVAVWDRGAPGARPSAPPPGLPVELRLLDPMSKERERVVLETSPAGTVVRDYRFPQTARTGRYRVEARVGDRLVTTETLSVETFVPERMKVALKPPQDPLHPSEPEAERAFRIFARWLFGGSAAGSRVELRCRLVAARPSFSEFPDHQFGLYHPDGPRAHALGAATGVLGPSGDLALACPPPDPRARALGAGRVEAEALVFEGAGGRSSQASARAWFFPSRVHVGLKVKEALARVGEPLTLDGVLVTSEGALFDLSIPVAIELFRVERERDWLFDPESQEWRYEEHVRLTSEAKTSVTARNGRLAARLTPGTRSGSYVLRATADDAVTEIVVAGSGSDFGDEGWLGERSDDRTPRPAAPAAVPLEVPAEVGRGERAVARARIPFPGRALFTIETDRLLQTTWRDVTPGPVEVPFAIQDLVPNAYLTALVLKDPHDASKESFVPARGFGVASIAVRPEALSMPLEIRAPKEIRSGSVLTVELDVGQGESDTEAFVAAVDEGILSLTGFPTPDPLAELFEKQALEVDTFDTIGWNLVLPAGGPGGRTGGDAEGAPGAVMPVEPVALWSGRAPVDAEGRATLRFDVPEYRGRLRIMAVAISSKRVGRGEAEVLVRDPVVLEPTVPRALTKGDRVEIPVLVSNLSGAPGSIVVRLEAEPLGPEKGGVDASADPSALLGLSPAERSVDLAPGKTETVWFDAEARALAGAVKVHARGRWGGGETSAAQTVVLRPDRPTERVSVIERVEGQTDLLEKLGGWVEGSERTQVILTRNPYAGSARHLEYLLDYPFGCAEQTASRTRALLYLDRFLGGTPREKDRPKMIQAGIDRLIAMQTASGGLAFWPGGDEPASWASAYALDLLLDLEREGYAVSRAALDAGLEWAEETVERMPRDEAVPYLHFVLAKAKRPRHAEIDAALHELSQRKMSEGRAREQRFLLLAARYLGGDRRGASLLKGFSDRPPDLAGRTDGGSFYSERRRQALELALLVELFGAEPWLSSVAERAAAALEGRSALYTTQELAWTLTALGRYLGEVPKGLPKARLLVDGEERSPSDGRDPEGQATVSWEVLRASERAGLVLEVERSTGPAPYLVLLTQGVRRDGAWNLGGEGLTVSEALVDERGEPVSSPGSKIRLGDLLYSVVRVQNLTGRRVRNVALVDLLPGGLEIVNPRLEGIETPSWLASELMWSVDHADFLDDRAEVFGALPPGREAVFFVPVRAVSAGRFFHPPVSAEAMYDPERWARAAAAPIVVTRD